MATSYSAKVELKNLNGQTLGNLDFVTNDFGSFSGQFVLPEKLMNGRAYFFIDGKNVAEILVEEYVRPSFEISLETKDQHYRLGDSVTYVGKVISYNGIPLSKAKVAYQIDHTLSYMSAFPNAAFSQKLLKADTVLTNENGEFSFKFLAKPFDHMDITQQNLHYFTKVEVTDQSGETQTKSASLPLRKNNIEINLALPSSLNKTDSLKLTAQLRNFSFKPLVGNLTAYLYQIDEKEYIKNRLFQPADSTLISLEDYREYFPEIAPIYNKRPSSYRKLVNSYTSETDSFEHTLIFSNTGRLQPGRYEIEIKAKSLAGDTVSSTSSFYWKDEKSLAIEKNQWLTVNKNLIKRTEKALFSINLADANVLMEVYAGEEKLKSQWIKTDKLPKSIEVSLEGKEELNIVFTTSSQNRLYSTSELIRQEKESTQQLKYSWIHFQNQLRPSEQTNFRLRITDKDGKPADIELLTTLYDASLDAIYQNGRWDYLYSRYSQRISNNSYNKRWNTYDYNQVNYSVPTRRIYYYPRILNRNYEYLDLAGYNYYGGYNTLFSNYRNRQKQVEINSYQDSLIKVQYEENAKLIKDGFDFSGRVVDPNTSLGMPGVIITLKGTNIKAVSNSFGYFRIKVKDSSVLVFEYSGHKLAQITARKDQGFQTISISKFGKSGYILDGFSGASSDMMLNEVTVTGYATQALQGKVAGIALETSQAEIQIRGNASFKRDASPYVQAEESDELFTSAGDIVGKSIRKNFAETAFFHAQLRPDQDGIIDIPFTVPDALTKWKFKAMAYDKALNMVYIDSSLITKKDLMLQAYMPRFLRSGDTTRIRVRITNLTDLEIQPKLQFQFSNALTHEVLPIRIDQGEKRLKIAAGKSETTEIILAIPQNVEAIQYRFIAQQNEQADGEEKTIPVLPNRILHQQSLSMLIKKGENKSFSLDQLVKNQSKTLENKSLTFEWTANPNWLVVDAIPYLKEPKYEGSETIFSAFYANHLANFMLKQNPKIREYLQQKAELDSSEVKTVLEQNPELRSILLQESPWLRDAEQAKKQQKQLTQLLSEEQLANQNSYFISKLKELQLSSGAFPWMRGTYEDRFISQHILAGIGQLQQIGQLNSNSDIEAIGKKLFNYVALGIEEDKTNNYYQLHTWYALSFFPELFRDKLKPHFGKYTQEVKKEWLSYNLYRQGLAALTLSRMGEKSLATTILNSIKDRAVQTKDKGAYWPNERFGCFWYQLPVETHCLMIEVLDEMDPSSTLLPELRLWLIRNKQVQQWGSSKATTAACYALLKQPAILENNQLPQIKIAGETLQNLAPAEKTEAYSGYIKTVFNQEEVKPALGKIEISEAPATSFGALHWQYVDEVQQIPAQSNGLTINRKYYLKSGEKYSEIKAGHQAKVGDLIKVIITVKSDRDYEYLLLTDYRPSGTETTQQLSGYSYQDRVFFYRVNKDVATNFFINRLPKGSYLFEYELRVAQSGTFESGLSSIESMYAPEFRANGKSQTLKFVR